MELLKRFNKLDSKEKSKIALLIILFIVGLILIFGSNLFLKDDNKEVKNTETESASLTTKEYKRQLENNIKNTLKKVDGVGEVDVTVTLSRQIDKEVIYNESTSGSINENSDTLTSKQESVSKDAVMVKEGSDQKPYTVSGEYPEVVGVVVVCEGARNSNTEYYITQSVQALLNISSYKVVVLPMKENV